MEGDEFEIGFILRDYYGFREAKMGTGAEAEDEFWVGGLELSKEIGWLC